MTKKQITGILIIALLATVLFMNFASAPGVVSKVEIKDKHDEHIFVVPGTQFCVERTLRNKDIEKISPVIVPLFSEGATLESIDVKRVIEEAYMEDVPDYGTCQRTVIERFDYDEAECDSLGYTWNTTNCYSETSEDYSCITGHHQEQRTREVVTYEPVLGGQYKDGEDSNDDEYVVDIFRSGLPDDVKALENIGYSTSFDLEDEATVRMCFRAPEFGSEISSGRISYMTYYGNGYDYESSSWWNSSYLKAYPITITNNGQKTHEHEIIYVNITDTDCNGSRDPDSARVLHNNETVMPHIFYDGTKRGLYFINNQSVENNTVYRNYTLYCNATGADDGNTSLFTWFDDFEDNDVTDWTSSCTMTAQSATPKEKHYLSI